MPSDRPTRPGLEPHRSSSNGVSPRPHQHRTHSHDQSSDSQSQLSNTPPNHTHKVKVHKAHVGGARLHARAHSHGKGLHKLTKLPQLQVENDHGVANNIHLRSPSATESPEPPVMVRNSSEPRLSSRAGSTTSLKKNSSQVSLKRNRSHVEVRRPKSAGGLKRSSSTPKLEEKKGQNQNKTTVHFALGNDAADDDGWEEASGSTSPEFSRGGSVAGSGRNSAKPPATADNSHSNTAAGSPVATRDWKHNENTPILDAHQITHRLLQRTPSMGVAPQLSTAAVTATPIISHGPPDHRRSTSTTNGANGTPHTAREELTSRFITDTNSKSSTPGSTSPYHNASRNNSTSNPKADLDPSRKSKSMHNLSSQRNNNGHDSDSDSDGRVFAASRTASRKPSASGVAGGAVGREGSHFYNPPQQSRTQQKLYLQRASSNIEPAQLAPPGVAAGLNGLGLGLSLGLGGLPALRGAHPGDGILAPLVGAGDDGKDPRIRLQLERTGGEYMVVRRYQDPLGRAIKRLDRLPGMAHDRMRRIPKTRQSAGHRAMGAIAGSGSRSNLGLSQSVASASERRRGRDGAGSGKENGTVRSSGMHSSYEAAGSLESDATVGTDDGGVSAIMRGLWEKNLDLSTGEE
jgi:hypothetical protein